VTDLALDGGDENPIEGIAESASDGMDLHGVVEECGGAVRVDVVDVRGMEACALERACHRASCDGSLGLGVGDVVRFGAGGPPHELGDGMGTACARVRFAFENEEGSSFT
jgi:hypothetical protein